MTSRKCLSRKHVDTLLSSESEDNSEVTADNSDVTATRNSEYDTPTCCPSERPTKLLHKSKPKIILELSNNLPENVRCVDIIKQILAGRLLG
jgi:hypothetical protein